MKILLVEDEIELAKEIQDFLHKNQMICEHTADAKKAIEKITLYDYDCILLDLMLPNGNGLDILRELKRQDKSDGVMIISAKDSLEVKIEGLTIGADDFLTKPFFLSELLVRIQAIVRRNQFQGNNIVTYNEIAVDTMAKAVSVDDRQVDLTRSEYDLLLYFVSNKKRVLSKGAIAEHLSGDMAEMLDNFDFVYAHIKNLKKKLKKAKAENYIKTVYGLGYIWEG